MANLFYLTRSDFISNASSGGMGTKATAIAEAWTDMGLNKIKCASNLSDLQSDSQKGWTPPNETDRQSKSALFDVVVLELLGLNKFEYLEQNIEILRDFPAPVVVYGSDSELLRWSNNLIKQLASVVDGWIANCEWQANYFRDFQLPVLGVVREPIDCELFRPTEHKMMSIVAGGVISHGKQSDFFIDLFKAIGETPYKTGYIGSSKGWGGKPDFRSLQLERDLKAVTDNFSGQVPQSKVASVLASTPIVVVNSHYETCNRFGMEAQASGACIVAGPHLCFDEWPNAKRFTTLEECVLVLSELTDGFTILPDKTIGEQTMKWAKESFSYEASLDQFNAVLRGVL